MLSFVTFVALALANLVAASVGSRRELKMESSLQKRDGVVNCSDSSEAAFISNSLSEAKFLANIASSWLEKNGVDDPVFISYFGTGQNNYTVQDGMFTGMFADYTTVLSCNDPNNDCQTGTVSHWNTDGIYFCPPFFDESDSTVICSGTNLDSLNVRGATLLRDVVWAWYGEGSDGSCSEARDVASNDPYSAAYDSDSYRCFAMQVYANTQCYTSGLVTAA